MPRVDGTGPSGQGPLTGRGMGYCAGFTTPGFMNPGFGRGFGRGRGFAFRARAMQAIMPIQQIQPQVITEKQEKQYLKEELEALKQEIEDIQKRLKELKE